MEKRKKGTPLQHQRKTAQQSLADNTVLTATSPEVLQRLLDEVDRVPTEFCLQISTKNESYGCYKRKD